MATKWPREVQDAIREAVARGERHSVAFAKVQAGTLPGLEGPVAMPARSFTYAWSRAKREQGQGTQAGPYTGPGFWDAMAVELAQKDGIEDPEELAEATGRSLEWVRDILEIQAEVEAFNAARTDERGMATADHTRIADLIAERRRAAEQRSSAGAISK